MSAPDRLSSRMLHVCQAGPAAVRVRTVVDDPVIEITDDGAIGPLRDIDDAYPRSRVAFWMDVLGESARHSSFDPQIHLTIAHQQLVQLARHRGAIVIWAVPHLTEQTMRRRLHWWLREAFVTIVEIRVSPTVTGATAVGTSLAMLDEPALREALDNAVVIRDEERLSLAHEWAALRECGGEVRVWQGPGEEIAGCPADHLDPLLLALADRGPVLLSRLAGEAACTLGYNEAFWVWRARQNVVKGGLQLVEGALEDSQPAWVCSVWQGENAKKAAPAQAGAATTDVT